MKFIIMAELLLGLAANGIRFYAIKRYIDFFVSKEKCRWKNIWISYILGCFFTYAVSEIFVTPSINVISNILALLLLLFPYDIKLTKKLFMIFVIDAVNIFADIIVIQLLSGYVSGQPVEASYELITSLAILISTAFLKRSQDEEKDVSLPLMDIFILGMIPIISIICMHCIAILTGNDKQVVLTAAFSLILINVFLFYLYHTLTKFYVAQMNKKKLEQMVDVYANQLDVMQESQERIKKLQHDMKHHMIELSAMAQQNSNEDMVRYLANMEKFMLNPSEKVSTGNREIDGVLNYMLRRADELLDVMDIDIQIPKQLYSKNFNICVILGNLVDNAIRESSKSDEKYLSVHVRVQKDVLLILVENSYANTVRKEANKFKTSQENTAIHGLGLESVRQVVESYEGDMKIEYTGNRFRVQVLIYLSNVI
ncbi:MAG: GHKL domain-containing protein [Eubacteriales bacterium]|nr:GHKL domain-containing protein [Eubacteriales bacterium]